MPAEVWWKGTRGSQNRVPPVLVANSLDEASHGPTGNQPRMDFLGGAVAKNPPANVGAAGLILGHGTGIPHATRQPGLCTTNGRPE